MSSGRFWCTDGGLRFCLRVWPPQGNPGRPAKERDAHQSATPGDQQGPQGPAWLRQDNPSRLKMTHTPRSGTGRQTPPPRSPSGPADSKAGRPQPKPRPSHIHKIWRLHPKRRRRRLRRMLSPETIIAETSCICKDFLLQSECLQYAKQGGRHE